MKKRNILLFLSFLGLGLFMAGVPRSAAALYEAGNDYNLYGHLYQDDVPVIGPMACCPTASINSFTYLQNQFPAVYGGRLASNPPTIIDVQRIAGPNYMNTDKTSGTDDPQVIWGRYLYIESKLPLQTSYSCQVATRDGQPIHGDQPGKAWPAYRPMPSYLSNAPGPVSVPTWQFIYQNLQRGADLGVGITYIESGHTTGDGHCLTLRGFSFDDKNNNGRVDKGEGSISFVDPAQKTEATYSIWQNSEAGYLSSYPYLRFDIDSNRSAVLDSVLAEYPAPQSVPDTVEIGNILVLSANAPYGILTFRGGVLYAADPQTDWNKAMILEAAERTIFDSATNQLTLTGAISGPGGLSKMGSGILFLRGTNSYSGGTFLSEGIVNVVQDANLGNPAASLTLKGGTLQAGADLSSSRPIILEEVPSITGVPGNSGFDTGIYNSIFSGTVTGPGYVSQTGRGSLTLTGDGSGYTGEYTLASGTLILEGALGNSMTGKMIINQNGTLKGSGILAVPTIVNHGTVNPGNSVGTLTMTGGYDQQDDGRLEVEINSASNYDRLRLTGYFGAAGLRGALKPILLDGYRPPGNTIFPGIITTDRGVYYTFDTIENNTPIRTWEAQYLTNQVDLTLTRDYAKASLGLNSNQQAVGTMFNGVADTTTGDLATALNALDNLPTGGAVADAYQQISPDKAGALPALSLAASMMQWRSLSNRLTYQRWRRDSPPPLAGGDFGTFNITYSRLEGARLVYNGPDLGSLVNRPLPEPEDYGQWGIYTDPVSTSASQDSSSNQTGYKFNIFGFTVGSDYRLRDDLLLGMGLGYYHTSSSYDSSGGSAAVNSIPFFTYAAYTPGAYYAMGSLGYTLNLYDLNRNLTFDGVGRTANGSADGSQFNAALETGYDLKFAGAILTPAATLFYSNARVGGFTETGAGSLNLNVNSQSADSLQSGVGVRVSRPFKTPKAVVLPQVLAFYQHEFADGSRGLNARLAQDGSAFTFQTDSPRRDFVVLGAGLALNLKNQLSLQANYNAELGRGNSTSHFLSAGVRWEF